MQRLKGQMSLLLAALLWVTGQACAVAAATPPPDAATQAQVSADCFFNWAERNYPSLLFPANAISQTLNPYYYRYYSGSNAYLGISSADNHVYYLGSAGLLDVGPQQAWLGTSGCLTYTYTWVTGTWGACSGPCGTNAATQSRTVSCQRSDGAQAPDTNCSGPKPVTSQACTVVNMCPSLSPSSTSIPPGRTAAFSVMVNGAASNAFNWSVAEGADGGSVTSAGVYTAPARMGLYHVVATSQSDPNKSATAPVTVADNIQTDRAVTLDFTQTQFSYTLNLDALSEGPMVIFKATNNSAKETTIGLQSITCNGYGPNGRPLSQTWQAVTRPGDTVFFKVSLEYGWCKGLPSGAYAVGSTEVQNVDFSISIDQPGVTPPSTTVTVPIRVNVSRLTDFGLPPGDTHIEVLLRDANGNPTGELATLATEYGLKSEPADPTTGKAIFNVAKAPGYWVSSENSLVSSNQFQSNSLHIDGNNIQPQYTLTVTPLAQWNVSAQLLATVKGRIGFWKASASKDNTKILMANGMENWPDTSLAAQSKLYLLDVQSGAVLWTHALGNQSWTSDISDDARYAVVATAPGFPLVVPTNAYVRLLDARDGSVLWTKYLDSSEFPDRCRSQPDFAAMGVKLSHDARFILVGLQKCGQAYLLNRSDGSIIWSKSVGEAREIIFSSDDRFIYTAPDGGWAQKLSTIDGTEVWRQFVGGFAYVNGFNISADEKHLCTATKSGDVTLLNTSDGSIIFQKSYGSWAGSCSISPDGKTLFAASGSSVGTDVIDVATGKEMRFRRGGAGEKRMAANGLWYLATLNTDFEINDAQGNVIRRFSERNPAWRLTHVGWLSADETRYIVAPSDVNAPSGDVDVIRIYSIRVTPP